MINAPHIETLEKSGEINVLPNGNKHLMRSKPYPPNFNKIPAKIIDPATGASTWALGNHRCVKYIGILIIKAIININQIKLLNL